MGWNKCLSFIYNVIRMVFSEIDTDSDGSSEADWRQVQMIQNIGCIQLVVVKTMDVTIQEDDDKKDYRSASDINAVGKWVQGKRAIGNLGLVAGFGVVQTTEKRLRVKSVPHEDQSQNHTLTIKYQEHSCDPSEQDLTERVEEQAIELDRLNGIDKVDLNGVDSESDVRVVKRIWEEPTVKVVLKRCREDSTIKVVVKRVRDDFEHFFEQGEISNVSIEDAESRDDEDSLIACRA
jgi:hypothetical protein